MRLKATNFPTYEFEIPTEKVETNDYYRVINQSDFDMGNNGGCQTAAVFACIESYLSNGSEPFKYSNDYLKKWYNYGDSVYEGKIEKVNRVVKFFGAYGAVISDSQRIYPKKVVKLSPANGDCTFQNFWDCLDGYAGIVIGLMPSSGFFSAASGMLYEQLRLPRSAGHAMRLYGKTFYKGKRALLLQNSWGEQWGMDGLAIVPEDKFHLLKFTSCYAFNFRVQSV